MKLVRLTCIVPLKPAAVLYNRIFIQSTNIFSTQQVEVVNGIADNQSRIANVTVVRAPRKVGATEGQSNYVGTTFCEKLKIVSLNIGI